MSKLTAKEVAATVILQLSDATCNWIIQVWFCYVCDTIWHTSTQTQKVKLVCEQILLLTYITYMYACILYGRSLFFCSKHLLTASPMRAVETSVQMGWWMSFCLSPSVSRGMARLGFPALQNVLMYAWNLQPGIESSFCSKHSTTFSSMRASDAVRQHLRLIVNLVRLSFPAFWGAGVAHWGFPTMQNTQW